MSADELLQNLNDAQRAAVLHGEGPLMIVAGAGTGKTRVITTRIAHLIATSAAKPREILGLTFTEKAAEEMMTRVDTLLPLGYEEVWIKTFHGFCERVLRERGHEIGLPRDFKLLSEMEQWIFLKRNLFTFDFQYYRPLGNPVKYFRDFIGYFSRLKDEYIQPEAYLRYAAELMAEFWIDGEVLASSGTRWCSGAAALEKLDDEARARYDTAMRENELARLYQQYQTALVEAGYLDFGDLCYYTVKLFEERPTVLRDYAEQFRYLMVDEFQDTNYVQTRLVLLLAKQRKNIVIVGDDDQGIYRWRGASLGTMALFADAFPEAKTVVLTENYRSVQQILDASYSFIQNNNPHRLEHEKHIDKRLRSMCDRDVAVSGDAREPLGNEIDVWHFAHYHDEVRAIVDEIERLTRAGCAYRDMAILGRTNAVLTPFVDELQARGIPFNVRTSESIFHLDVVKDLVAVARILTNPRDTVAMYRLLTMPTFDIPMEEVAALLHDARTRHLDLFSLMKERFTGEKQGLLDAISELRRAYDVCTSLLPLSKGKHPGQIFLTFLELSGYLRRLVDSVDPLLQNKLQNDIEGINAFARFVREFEQQERNHSLYDLLDYIGLIERSDISFETRGTTVDYDAVAVSTIHSAKGLEFRTVFITGLAHNKFPSIDRRDAFEVPTGLVRASIAAETAFLEEERRLMYVAMTRAREQLVCSYSTKYGGPKSWKPSRFLKEVFPALFGSNDEPTEPAVRVAAGDAVSSGAASATTDETVLYVPGGGASGVGRAGGARISLSNLSYTQLNMFKTCPLKYRFAYLLHMPTQPAAATSFGSTIHKALHLFYRAMKDGAPPSVPLIEQFYEQSWVAEGYESEAHEAARRKEGRELLRAYYDRHTKAGWVIPSHLEVPFSIKVGDARVTGRIDRIDQLDDGTYEIIDYKTGSLARDLSLKNDLQLSIYALAARDSLHIPVSRLSLYFISDGTVASTTRDESSLAAATKTITDLVDAMKVSSFEPKPNPHYCQFCDFRLICPAV